MTDNIIYIIAQGLAFISALFFTISILQKTKNNLMSHQIINTFTGVISMVLLQNYPAAITDFMAFIRSFLIRLDKAKKLPMYIIAFVIIVVSLVFNTKGIIGFLPAIAGAEYTIALIYTKSLRSIHIATLINVILWCIHDWVLGIYPFAICNTLNIIILVISLIKGVGEDKE